MDPHAFDTMMMVFMMVSLALLFGWIATTWLKVRNGYPLSGLWGRQLHPRTSDEAVERVALITQENAQLRAELGAVKDRLANVERIVTDSSFRLDHEIARLREPAN